MGRFFAVVRPETPRPRGRIYSLLESLGYQRGHGMVLPSGTPDPSAARWVDALEPDLLVLPYHLHRDRDGRAVDGVGVALLLSTYFEGQVPIVMPVSHFSKEAGLDHRLAELRAERPLIFRNVIPLTEEELNSARVSQRILRAGGTRSSLPPAVGGASVLPPTVRHGSGYTGEPRDERDSERLPRVPPLVSYRSPELREALEVRGPPSRISGVFAKAPQSKLPGPKVTKKAKT